MLLKKICKIYDIFYFLNYFKLFMMDKVIKEDVIELLGEVQEFEKEE